MLLWRSSTFHRETPTNQQVSPFADSFDHETPTIQHLSQSRPIHSITRRPRYHISPFHPIHSITRRPRCNISPFHLIHSITEMLFWRSSTYHRERFADSFDGETPTIQHLSQSRPIHSITRRPRCNISPFHPIHSIMEVLLGRSSSLDHETPTNQHGLILWQDTDDATSLQVSPFW